MSSLASYVRRLRSASQPGGVVLLYHRVADLDRDPQCLAVSPARFASHLATIVRAGVPMSLQALLSHSRSGTLPAGAVAVTFDDGYADNLTNAAPLLVDAGVPATMFLSTGAIVNESEFWWDELERAMTAGTIDNHTYDDLCQALRPMRAEERETVLAGIAARGGITRSPRESHRPLREDEVATLAAMPGITIGAHTHSHPSLAFLPVDVQRAEIAESRRELERLTSRPVDSVAYPFGGTQDVSSDTIAAARSVGMTIACTTTGGRVNRQTDHLAVPRAVIRDWTGEEFAQRFTEWTGVAAG
jgi:peptidoglycan/xylan/chitin deacetylase (PgdA/CDA1 family)